MGIFNYTTTDRLSYTCEGWYIKFRLPCTIDNMQNSLFDIERTKTNNTIKCFCGSGCSDIKWNIISECQIPDYPLAYLFNSKEEALENFNKLVNVYGKNLTFDDIFISIHHCKIDHKFTYIYD